MKESHTALFVAPTGVGKTRLALDLLESEYQHHFDFIIIIKKEIIALLSRDYSKLIKRS